MLLNYQTFVLRLNKICNMYTIKCTSYFNVVQVFNILLSFYKARMHGHDFVLNTIVYPKQFNDVNYRVVYNSFRKRNKKHAILS